MVIILPPQFTLPNAKKQEKVVSTIIVEGLNHMTTTVELMIVVVGGGGWGKGEGGS